jgi:hypothetical protein
MGVKSPNTTGFAVLLGGRAGALVNRGTCLDRGCPAASRDQSSGAVDQQQVGACLGDSAHHAALVDPEP